MTLETMALIDGLDGIHMLVMIFLVASWLFGQFLFLIFNLASLNLKYKTPIGALALIGILQIGYYKFQVNHLPFEDLVTHTKNVMILVSVLGGLSFLFRLFTLDYHLSWSMLWQIPLVYVIYKMIIHYYTGFTAPYFVDDSFFMYDMMYAHFTLDRVNEMFMDVANAKYILEIDRSLNGLYHFYAVAMRYLGELKEYDVDTTVHYIGTFTWFGTGVIAVILPLTIFDMYNYAVRNGRKALWVAIPLLFIISFEYYYVYYGYYGHTWMKLTLAFLLLFLNELFKSDKIRYAIIGSVLLFSLTAQTSTALFIGTFVVYSYGIVALASGKKNVFLNIFLQYVPLAIFIYYFSDLILSLDNFKTFNQPELLETIQPLLKWFGVLLLLMHGLTYTKLREHLLIFQRIAAGALMVALPIGLYYLGTKVNPFYPAFFSDTQHTMSFIPYGFDFTNAPIKSFFLVYLWVGMIALVGFSFFRSDHRGIGWMIPVFLVTFFNPWVYDAIATYVADISYHRLLDALFNPFTIVLFFVMVANGIDLIKIPPIKLFKGKIKIPLYLSVIVGLGLYIYAKEHHENNQIYQYYDEFESVNVETHTFNQHIEVLEKLNEEYLKKEEETINVIAQVPIPNQLYREFIGNNLLIPEIGREVDLYQYSEDPYKQYLYASFPKSFHNQDAVKDYSNVCQMNLDNDVKYVIIESQYNPDYEFALGYCAVKVFELNTYRVFEMNPWMWNDYLKRKANSSE